MIRVRSILMLAVIAAMAIPGVASADPSVTRVSISSQATWVSPQQINLELSLSCPEGLFYNAGASVLQQQGPFTHVYGNGWTNGQCTGRHQKIAVSVYTFSFPGWQLGDAFADAYGCAFACDSTSRAIRIGM